MSSSTHNSTSRPPAQRQIRSICVYCGSSPGKNPVHMEDARRLAKLLVDHGIQLVYGGGDLGLMGELARVVLNSGGRVLGIIPEALAAVCGIIEGSESIVVGTMHERKALMSEKADAFIALPGGFGTAEELVETITWSQLRIHDKPVGVLNTNGFYQHLIDWMDTAHREGFIDDRSRRILVVDNEPEKLLANLLTYEDPLAGKHAYGLSKQMWNGGSKPTSPNKASQQTDAPEYRI